MMFSDEELRRAARELSLAVADQLPAQVECDHRFSPAYTRRMNRLLRKSRHPTFHCVMRVAAGFLLAIIVGSGIWLTFDAEAREAFFGWFGVRNGTAMSYSFDGPDASETPNVRYRLKEAPKGYEKFDSFETQLNGDESYGNEAGQGLSFGYIFSPTASGIAEIAFCDVDKMEKVEVEVNGLPADCYIDPAGEIGNVLVWQDRETDAMLYLSGYFDKADMIRMAEEVIREEK